jgi:hypothetical protein
MPTFKCLCDKTFNKKYNLDRHLSTNACKSIVLPQDIKSQLDIYNMVKQLNTCKDGINITNNINNNCNNTINININIPLSELSFKGTEDALYNMIENYSNIQQVKNTVDYKNVKDVKYLISDYIKTNLCDKNKPEMHCIKYISKYPLAYNISEKRDMNGDIINSIRGFKDSVDLLSDPILKNIKRALISFEKILIIENKKATEDGSEALDALKYDYGLYDTTIKALKNELNKKNVQAALKQFLKHDILNDINMKLTIN